MRASARAARSWAGLRARRGTSRRGSPSDAARGALALAVAIVVAWGGSAWFLYGARDASQEVLDDATIGFVVTYLGGPGDELVMEHDYELPAPATVHAYQADGSEIVEISNWSLPAGQRLAWSYGEVRGFLQLTLFLPTQAAPVETRLVWIGNATVLIGETPEDLIEGARRQAGAT